MSPPALSKLSFEPAADAERSELIDLSMSRDGQHRPAATPQLMIRALTDELPGHSSRRGRLPDSSQEPSALHRASIAPLAIVGKGNRLDPMMRGSRDRPSLPARAYLAPVDTTTLPAT